MYLVGKEERLFCKGMYMYNALSFELLPLHCRSCGCVELLLRPNLYLEVNAKSPTPETDFKLLLNTTKDPGTGR